MPAAVVEIALLVAAMLGAAWGAIMVHEVGHYLGGLSLGVPADSMRIRLERPPHVALRQGDAWFSPDEPEYVSAFAQHNSSVVAAWLFVAGGFLLETFVLLVLAAVFHGFGTLSIVIVAASTAVFVTYLICDVALSIHRARPYGDIAAMWHIFRAATVVAIVAVLLLRTGAIFLLV